MVMGTIRQETDVVVVGGGPGGYVAAIRAADLGHEVLLVEDRDRLGGVCLLEGCIPSKTIITAIEIANTARDAKKMGLSFDNIKIDAKALRAYTENVVGELSRGIDTLLDRRGIEVIQGRARLVDANELAVDKSDLSGINFKHCILATGSRVTHLPIWTDLDVWTSTEALELRSVPERLLVVGGGYVGLELGFAYAGLGSKVTVVEVLPQLLTGADPDLVQPVRRSCRKRFEAVLLNTRVTGMSQNNGRFMVTLENKDDPAREAEFDQVLVAVGRTPNTTDIGLEGLGIQTDRLGLIPVSEEMRTRVPHIFAIGDAVPGPGLAHKASREGKVAAEVINKQPAAFDNVSVPAVVFTEPEVAWAGLTEQRATNEGYKIKVGKFSLSALGRAKSVGRTDGLAKVIASAETGAIVGVGLVGPHASELIGEAVLALEMGAVLEDITTTIHPHPTFSEALLEAAEMAQGTSVHVAPSRRI